MSVESDLEEVNAKLVNQVFLQDCKTAHEAFIELTMETVPVVAHLLFRPTNGELEMQSMRLVGIEDNIARYVSYDKLQLEGEFDD